MNDLYVWGIKTTTNDPLAVEALKAEGSERIAKERVEQFIKHRRSIKDDVLHNPNGELIQAARALMKPTPVEHDFPDSWGVAACRKMINKSYLERLTIAGALIAAEIDRFLYIEEMKLKRNTPKIVPKDLGYYPLTPNEAFPIDRQVYGSGDVLG